MACRSASSWWRASGRRTFCFGSPPSSRRPGHGRTGFPPPSPPWTRRARPELPSLPRYFRRFMATISGVLTAMVTPFDADGALDLGAARRLARHLVDNGSHGLVLSGTTGESPTLSDQEKLGLWQAATDEGGVDATI